MMDQYYQERMRTVLLVLHIYPLPPTMSIFFMQDFLRYKHVNTTQIFYTLHMCMYM